MWNLLDSLGRPPLLPHLEACALELNRHALRLLREGPDRDPGSARALVTTVTAGAACWWALRPVLGERPWRMVKASARKQRRLLGPLETQASVEPAVALAGLVGHARSAPERRCLSRLIRGFDQQHVPVLTPERRGRLERALLAQSRALTPFTGRDSEAGVRGSIVGIYRKARTSLHQDPWSGRARRRLGALMWIEELLAGGIGPITHGCVPATAAGRLWKGLEESRWLRGLSGVEVVGSLRGKDTQRLSRLVRRRRRALAVSNEVAMTDAVRETVEVFAARLPWRVFRSLAEPPVALVGDDAPAEEARPDG